jgi:hypothetical protein
MRVDKYQVIFKFQIDSFVFCTFDNSKINQSSAYDLISHHEVAVMHNGQLV